jgi:DNA-binding GntR family transcriptional regulator
LQKKIDSEVVAGIESQNALFHSTLRNASQNSHLIGLIENMRSIDKTIRQVSLRRDTEEQIRAHKEHLGILEAMKERNGKEAEERMNAHVRRVGDYVVANNKK